MLFPVYAGTLISNTYFSGAGLLGRLYSHHDLILYHHLQ